MKIFYVSSTVCLALGVSSSAPSVTATRLRRRGLQDCPLPADIACSQRFEQVDCGGCVYNNPCLADAAGMTECTLVEDEEEIEKEEQQQEEECPLPGPGLCTLELLPVTCGSNNCPYDNLCLAEKAGFATDEDCNQVEPNPAQQECPTPGPGTACGFILLPVVCQGGCEYDNDCLANAAGFTDCSPSAPFCPTPSENIACTAEVTPVECGEFACWYENECVAGAAGFVGCTPAGVVSPCKRSDDIDCSDPLQFSETIDPSSTTMNPTMDETGALTESPADFDLESDGWCSHDGVRFTCLFPYTITAGDSVTLVNNMIQCDERDSPGDPDDFQRAENCVCSAELSTQSTVDGTEDDTRERNCACAVCPIGSMRAVSLDCSMVPEDPFVAGQCMSLGCDGQCQS